jgi:hypothetical protein
MLSLLLIAAPAVFNITDFGASPSPGDDTAAIQAAFDRARANPGSTVKVPTGSFEANGLVLPSNVTLEGVGPTSVIKTTKGGIGGMIIVNPVNVSDARTRLAEKNITIRNLTLEGNTATEGYKQHTDLLRFYGAEDVVIEKVKFLGFRGDGLYIGDGLADKGVIRHNKNVVVRDCTFDGVNKQNRNGITVGDGENVTIQRCTFVRTTGPNSPGNIDIEQNKNDYHIGERISVLDCTFNDNGGTAIVLDIAIDQQKRKKPIREIVIRGNRISKQQRRGILLNQLAEFDPNSEQVGITIERNDISDVPIPIAIEGVQGVKIINNIIRNTERGVMIGYGKKGRGTQNVDVLGNTFEQVGSDPKFGGAAVLVFNALNVNVTDNTIKSLVGGSKSYVLFAGASGGSRAGKVTITGNRSEQGSLSPYRVFGSAVELDTSSIKTGND